MFSIIRDDPTGQPVTVLPILVRCPQTTSTPNLSDHRRIAPGEGWKGKGGRVCGDFQPGGSQIPAVAMWLAGPTPSREIGSHFISDFPLN